MSTLSVCVIAKNEAANIERAISTILPVADEVIVVDTGSTDNTKEIAAKYTDKIYDFKWIDDFGAAYNYCQSKASMDFCVRWDADFSITKADAKRLLKAKQDNFNGANLACLNWIAESTKDNRVLVMRDLIFKRTEFHNKYPIHAKITPNKGVKVRVAQYPDIYVQHHKQERKPQGRHDQTAQMMEKALAQYPDDLYLQMQQLDGLLFAKDYAAVVKAGESLMERKLTDAEQLLVVEKLVLALNNLNRSFDALELVESHESLSRHPRFLLLKADTVALFDPEEAVKLYKQYLATNYQAKDSIGGYNEYRFQVHPKEMIKQLA